MRPRALPALLALLLLGGCGSDSKGDAGSAKGLLERAGRTHAKSANLKLSLEARLRGVERLDGPLKLTLEGPFRSNGPRTLPDLDWRVHLEGGAQKVDTRLVTVRDNAYVEYAGRTYEVGEQLVKRYSSRYGDQRKQQGDLRALGVDASNWLKDPEVEDGGSVGGASTRKVSGELDVRRLLEDLNQIFKKLPTHARMPGVKAPQISDADIDKAEDAVEEGRLEVWVGRDGIARRTRFDASFEVPEDQRSRAKGLEGGSVKLRAEQSDVNGDQRIEAPSGARPLSELLGGFGLSPALPG